ncbi:beta-lactamase/transpeptidase-like protein [Gonapodya prolifera JEL478]|uniref:Beta-lactamase/transpeptidase-like protein n=1 Tax=Gonapodya prolifera (strain JEL478) TaxID=1344416 RepID=A0A139AXP9_GONPJ|nr:beta-lactamase/transpeptidase-like protein [Gonapodya prolifera JEL478]|eukprot:KXS21489.1 beta-lactamase/transpeptidase-like protein [Gonapodya prolifera JEL478]
MAPLPRADPSLPHEKLSKLRALLQAFDRDARHNVPTYEYGRGKPVTPEEVRGTEMGFNLATFIVHRGKVIAEFYSPLITPDRPLVSWSMAKSITHIAFGIVQRAEMLPPIDHGLGRLRLEDGRFAVQEWKRMDDPRGEITIRHLLQMRSGLEFNEDYDAEKHSVSDVQQMLFSRPGKTDVGKYAAEKPLQKPPGTEFRYSSGTTNILARLLTRIINPLPWPTFIREHLFDPLGVSQGAYAVCDQSGTIIGSSFVFATAEDYARLGMLYLQGGVWDNVRLVDKSWVDMAMIRTGGNPDDILDYSYHWWISRDSEVPYFRASGFEGQFIVVVPSLDLVLVRLGRTPDKTPQWTALQKWMDDVVTCFMDEHSKATL